MTYEARARTSKPSCVWCGCLGGTHSDEGYVLTKKSGYVIKVIQYSRGTEYWIPGKFVEKVVDISVKTDILTKSVQPKDSVKKLCREDFLNQIKGLNM